MNKQNVDELRNYYMKHPPKGFSSKEISKISDKDIFDIDYFLMNKKILSHIGFFMILIFPIK